MILKSLHLNPKCCLCFYFLFFWELLGWLITNCWNIKTIFQLHWALHKYKKKFSCSSFWEVIFLPQDLKHLVGYLIIDKTICIICRNLGMAGSCSKENVLRLHYTTKFLQLLQLCLNPNGSGGGRAMFLWVMWFSISLSTMAISIPSRPLFTAYSLQNVIFLPTSQFYLLWPFPLVLDTNPDES